MSLRPRPSVKIPIVTGEPIGDQDCSHGARQTGPPALLKTDDWAVALLICLPTPAGHRIGLFCSHNLLRLLTSESATLLRRSWQVRPLRSGT